MCGIAGFCTLTSDSFTAERSLLERLSTVLHHRGPDGDGYWVCQKHRIALVHRRLTIVDLTDAGAQPMTDADETVVVSFNGELYNHQEIRALLIARGYTFSSTSDTQTLIYAYKEWGIDCIRKFDGMFSIVLFDQLRNELYLIRDRIGIKPLYFSLQGGMLSFASEIKALWQLPWMHKKIRPDAISHYLTYLATPAPMTFFEGIYKLPAGFYIKVHADRSISFHEWYTPLRVPTDEERAIYENEDACVDTIRTLLRSSVKKHMMADVPVGVFLSGGIDSSLNVALMASCTNRLKTFNVSFVDGPALQERVWAQKIAQKFGTEHHELIIDERDAFMFFEKMVYHQDEPLGDSVCVPLYYVAKLARDAGVKVVQVGEGADELFCGYDTYAQYLRIYNTWYTAQHYIPALFKYGIAHLASYMYKKQPNMVDLVNAWAHNRPLFWGGVRVFSEQWKKDIMHRHNANAIDPIIEQIYPGMHQGTNSYDILDYHRNQLYKQDPHADFLKAMIYLEFKHRLPELLLMRVDKMTMATSVESRVPFLDHHLIEFVLNMPMHMKYRNGITKYILKKACEGIVPYDVIYRKKMGFAAPARRWFKSGQYFKPYFSDMLHSSHEWWSDVLHVHNIQHMMKENSQGTADYTYQLWALQNLMAMQQ